MSPSRDTPAWMLVATAATLCAAGCESDLSNDVFTGDEAFAAAVPSREVLRLAARSETGEGLDAARQALGAETAALYRVTRDVTWNIDHDIFGTLDGLEAVVVLPPTERGARTRTWGPYREALSPIEVRLVVTRDDSADAGDVFTYSYELRPVGGTFVPAISGTWAPGDASPDGAGHVVFDLVAFGGAGRVEVDYARAAGAVDFAIDVDGYEAAPGETPSAAYYEAHRAADGGGALSLAYRAAEGEAWAMHSRWQADGAGRADALALTGVEPADAPPVTECWDADFTRVYASGEGESGDAAACVFADRVLPDEKVYAGVDFLFGDAGAAVSKSAEDHTTEE